MCVLVFIVSFIQCEMIARGFILWNTLCYILCKRCCTAGVWLVEWLIVDWLIRWLNTVSCLPPSGGCSPPSGSPSQGWTRTRSTSCWWTSSRWTTRGTGTPTTAPPGWWPARLTLLCLPGTDLTLTLFYLFIYLHIYNFLCDHIGGMALDKVVVNLNKGTIL